jgi:hypothetical protein
MIIRDLFTPLTNVEDMGRQLELQVDLRILHEIWANTYSPAGVEIFRGFLGIESCSALLVGFL